MTIEITDDFDMEKIAISGQCFRAKKFDDGTYRFISGEKIIYLKEEHPHNFSVSCEKKEWENFWVPYFDLKRNYAKICDLEYGKNSFIREAMDYGRGLRILRQDSWETLITFIASQRKNIPAISKSVEIIAEKYGHIIETGREKIYSFPTCEEMLDATEEELLSCSVGYRAKYILDAVRQVHEGSLDLDAINKCSDDDLLEKLMQIHGVGKKVANCVALFAYGRTGCVPIDVWIARAIEEDFSGKSPFELYGKNAGIMQQYVFFYKRQNN